MFNLFGSLKQSILNLRDAVWPKSQTPPPTFSAPSAVAAVNLPFMNDRLLLLHDTTRLRTMSAADLEAACRPRCQTLYVGYDMVLCRVLGKFLLYADALDQGIAPHLCMDGYWEAWITLVMARTLQPGWNCVDIGANHGYYTLLMGALSGASGGRVLSVEPNPKLAMLLRKTLEVNGMQSFAKVSESAIAAQSGTMKLVIPKSRGMNATLYRRASAGDEVVEVEVNTLDNVIQGWPRVDFVKVDAEGAEEEIWKGMQVVVQNNPDIVVMMEINCARYKHPKAFLESILAAGFTLKYVDFDARIKDLTMERCLAENFGHDWMLFLKRG